MQCQLYPPKSLIYPLPHCKTDVSFLLPPDLDLSYYQPSSLFPQWSGKWNPHVTIPPYLSNSVPTLWWETAVYHNQSTVSVEEMSFLNLSTWFRFVVSLARTLNAQVNTIPCFANTIPNSVPLDMSFKLAGPQLVLISLESRIPPRALCSSKVWWVH